jgi:hypothetical protein
MTKASVDINALSAALFRASVDVRYVALYQHGRLQRAERAGVLNASGAESDRYEELLVNPTLLTLATQRGDIDCGGLEFLLIRYGHFFQLIHPVRGGHLSVAIEASVDPLALLGTVRAAAHEYGLLPSAT